MIKKDDLKLAYDPLGEISAADVVKCPACHAQDFAAFSNQYGVHRKCNKCGNEWSGGGVGSFPEGAVPPPAQIPVEDDYPLVQFTGGPHRRFGGDE
jgi:hypothetical protein